MRFGKRLKTLRELNGWNQYILAEKCGLSASAISLYENSNRVPQLKSIIKFSEVFGMTIDEIFNKELPEIKEPRVFRFKTFIGENLDEKIYSGDSNCPLTNIFGHKISFFYNAMKEASSFDKISKWEILMKEIIE